MTRLEVSRQYIINCSLERLVRYAACHTRLDVAQSKSRLDETARYLVQAASPFPQRCTTTILRISLAQEAMKLR